MFVNRLSECFVSVLEIEHAIVNRVMPDGLGQGLGLPYSRSCESSRVLYTRDLSVFKFSSDFLWFSKSQFTSVFLSSDPIIYVPLHHIHAPSKQGPEAIMLTYV